MHIDMKLLSLGEEILKLKCKMLFNCYKHPPVFPKLALELWHIVFRKKTKKNVYLVYFTFLKSCYVQFLAG